MLDHARGTGLLDRRRDPQGRRYDELLAGVADDLGVDPELSVAVFRALTRESLGWPAPWPSRRLSCLAAGLPVEMSATDGPPALRYAVEVGDPARPAYPRAAGGLRALGRAAELLGHDAAWARARPVLAGLVTPALAGPARDTFWVWAGADLPVPPRPPVLKAYVNLLDREAAGGGDRLAGALRALGVPSDAPAATAADRLGRWGSRHGLGLRIGPAGGVGAKVYWRLPGWNPDAVSAALAHAGLPPDPAVLTPEIPGVLQERLARRSRTFLEVSIRLPAGAIEEVAVAVSLPPALVGQAEFARRVRAWLVAGDGDPTTYDALTARILPARSTGSWRGEVHTLVTRTRSRSGVRDTVYLCPPPDVAGQHP